MQVRIFHDKKIRELQKRVNTFLNNAPVIGKAAEPVVFKDELVIVVTYWVT